MQIVLVLFGRVLRYLFLLAREYNGNEWDFVCGHTIVVMVLKRETERSAR